MQKIIRSVLLALACLFCVVIFRVTFQAFQPGNIYERDFIAYYLMARAVVAGEGTYAPIPDLAARHLGVSLKHYPHPTPHTPITGLLYAPLALLSFRGASILWFCVQLVALVCSALLIRGVVALNTSRPLAIAVFVLVGAGPLLSELWMGQIDLLLLVLLSLAWIDLRTDRETRGGVWLGLVLAIKLTGWPIVIYLAIRRRWRAVLSAGAVVVAGNLMAGSVIGFGVVRDYYLEIGPQVSAVYRTHGLNFSAYALGRRLFEGTHARFDALALWPSEALAAAGGIVAPMAVLLFGLWLAVKAAKLDAAFGLLVCVSLLINPTAWEPYLVMAAIPMAITFAALRRSEFPRGQTLVAVLWSVLLLTPSFAITMLAEWLGVQDGNLITLSPLLAFALTAFPAVCLLALGWLTWRTSRTHAPITSA